MTNLLCNDWDSYNAIKCIIFTPSDSGKLHLIHNVHLWLDGHIHSPLLLCTTTALAELSIQKPFCCLGLFGIHTKGNCSCKLLDSLGVLTRQAELTESCSYSHLHLKTVGRGELHNNLEAMVHAQVGKLACGPYRMSLRPLLLLYRREPNHQIIGHWVRSPLSLLIEVGTDCNMNLRSMNPER